jgi:Ca2+-binding EF-hand superfamily protein
MCKLDIMFNYFISKNFSETALLKFKNDFLKEYDLNADGKLTVDEMAELLPVDENLIFLFQRNNPLESTADFLKIWCKFDTNLSGSIESCELEDLIKFILSKKDGCLINRKKLFEYRFAIVSKTVELN